MLKYSCLIQYSTNITLTTNFLSPVYFLALNLTHKGSPFMESSLQTHVNYLVLASLFHQCSALTSTFCLLLNHKVNTKETFYAPFFNTTWHFPFNLQITLLKRHFMSNSIHYPDLYVIAFMMNISLSQFLQYICINSTYKFCINYLCVMLCVMMSKKM